MPSSNTVRATYSVDVHSGNPGPRFKKYTSFRVSGGSPEGVGYVSFPVPYPRQRVNIKSATLRLVQANKTTTSATVSVRPAAKAISYAKLAYNNHPGGNGLISTESRPASGAGAVWEFDVTRQVQAMVQGSPNYGWNITKPGAAVAFWGFNSSGSRVPTLSVEWTLSPLTPGSLAPSGGRVVGEPRPTLRWGWFDEAGATSMKAFQVQLSPHENFSTITYDSGVTRSTHCELDLASTSAPVLTDGGGTYWRVRNQDTDDLWSDWSNPALYYYRKLPVVTAVNPTAGLVVDDATPRFDWSYSSPSPQEAWAVGVYELLSNGRRRLVAKSGKRGGTATSWALTSSLKADTNYAWDLQVWDSHPRESTPGARTDSRISTKFRCDPDSKIDPATNLVWSTAHPFPHGVLTWDRAVQPDEWIVRGPYGEVRRMAGDVPYNTKTGRYGLSIYEVEPRATHTYRVHPVVNRKIGPGTPKLIAGAPLGTWLTDADQTQKMCIFDEGIDLTMEEEVTYYEVVGARQSVPELQDKRGYSGTVRGTVARTNREIGVSEDTLEWFKNNEGDEMWLYVGTRLIKCTVSNLTWFDQDAGEGNFFWDVSFRIDQLWQDVRFSAVSDWGM